MAKRSKISSRRFSILKRRWLLLSFVALVLVVAGFLSWHHSPAIIPLTADQTNSGVKPAPSSQNATRTPASQNTSVNQGSAVDKNGQAPAAATGSSQWTAAADGLITLKEPLKDNAFKSGDTLYGAAASGPVQFRLIDNQVGVIAQGTINVVNGSFSATANFTPYGTSGRLDVFNTDQNGKEINEVQVPVAF